MKRPPGKFIGFFKFVEAMKRPGCPACARILEDTHHAMESFLYESVNDPELRSQIRRDRGLCHRHCWQLASFGDALGGAILFRDVLEKVIPSLGAAHAVGLFHKRAARSSAPPCLFCRRERQSLDHLLADLVAHIEDAELLAGWRGPAVLCMGHLGELCSLLDNSPARLQIIELHRQKYRGMCEAMGELIKAQSYDRTFQEASTEQQKSWLAAIEALVGRAGIR